MEKKEEMSVNEMNQYATAVGLTPESLKYRDTEHGGLSYYIRATTIPAEFRYK